MTKQRLPVHLVIIIKLSVYSLRDSLRLISVNWKARNDTAAISLGGNAIFCCLVKKKSYFSLIATIRMARD